MTSPLLKIPKIEIPGLQFQIVEVGPILAAEWLKRNKNNRKVKEPTLEAYAQDMTNGDWMLTHQAVAFDQEGNLIDGQHRLLAIVRSRATVQLFVTCGWPAGKGKRKTMDAVDRGCVRSIADQLRLQHGINNSKEVVKVANAIGSICLNAQRIRKGSTATVLAVVALFPDEMKYVLDTAATQRGIRNANVAGAIALGRAVWPEKTSDFWTRLRTGENLARDNPALHLRNWLTSGDYHSSDEIYRTTLYCLKWFVEGKAMQVLGGRQFMNEEGRTAVLQPLAERAKKVCKIYGSDLPQAIRNGEASVNDTHKPAGSAFGEEAVRVGHSLPLVFTTTDMQARVDGHGSGVWIVHWKNRGWIEPLGPGQFRKTEIFPKPEAALAA